jgi:hypothetical protein
VFLWNIGLGLLLTHGLPAALVRNAVQRADDSYMAGDGKNACLWEKGVCGHDGLSEVVQQLSSTTRNQQRRAVYTVCEYVVFLI